MARTKNDANIEPIRKARLSEKLAIEEAKIRAKVFIENETRTAHSKVLDAIRDAILAGASKRQISIAYGTTDMNTITKLITEATADIQTIEESNDAWKVTPLGDGAFSLEVWHDGGSGVATVTLDDDMVNFTAIDGDLWVASLVYRLGFAQDIARSMNGRA